LLIPDDVFVANEEVLWNRPNSLQSRQCTVHFLVIFVSSWLNDKTVTPEAKEVMRQAATVSERIQKGSLLLRRCCRRPIRWRHLRLSTAAQQADDENGPSHFIAPTNFSNK
jgi:hypothetical protein